MMVEWWDDRNNVATLVSWMADNGHTMEDVVYAVEKPWKYEDEYKQCLKELARERHPHNRAKKLRAV